jgi:hypothetical protein
MIVSHSPVQNASLGKQQAVPDLKIAEPDFGVEDGECKDVVDERLDSSSLGRYTKYLFNKFNQK